VSSHRLYKSPLSKIKSSVPPFIVTLNHTVVPSKHTLKNNTREIDIHLKKKTGGL